MTLKDDLVTAVDAIALEKWETNSAKTVPDLAALTLGNSGKTIDACFLYADLSDSTGIVERVSSTLAAEYYKSFLWCSAKIIVANEGSIEAYDGDRVMGVFVGSAKEENAVLAAMKINYCVGHIINPAFSFHSNHIPIQHTVGIDSGSVLVCKAGVRGDNELVWVGSPANHAAKLNSFTGLDHSFPTRITQTVKAKLPPYLLQSSTGSDVWDGPYHNVGTPHFRSSFYMEL
ncbi:MAG TPA: adenylate/guanylate cyclase domain-containing protein [Luteimonas sp.]|nr:adenylate/guanylate cyclase domain-containing protein [Luteimonas sp.]